MPDPALNVGDEMSGIALVPEPVERLGHDPELDDEVVRQIFRFDLTPLLPP
jgi:hypothetical protein